MVSTSTTSTPWSCNRLRNQSYSAPFVSRVPSKTTVFKSRRLLCKLFHSEEPPLRGLVREQRRRGRLVRDASGDHHEQPIGERRREAEVLLDEQQRYALGDERAARLD